MRKRLTPRPMRILLPVLVAIVSVNLDGIDTVRAEEASATTNRRADAPAPQREQPNVLFIISDDLSAHALSCYGNANCQTPHIDRLAERGIRFSNAFCQFPVCGPSRAALMSGMYPDSLGVMGNGQANRFSNLIGQRPTFAQYFRQHDYYTARVSKIYHMRVPGDITAGVDGPDHAPSWVERFNCQGPEWFSEGEKFHLSNERLNFDRDKHYGLGFGTAFYVVKSDTDGTEQPDVQAATKAIELLEKHQDKPFFLAVGLVRPHVPLVAPKAFYEPYPADQMKLPERVENDWDDIPRMGVTKNSKSSGLDDDHRKQEVLSAYYASVAFMDAQVGRMLDALQRLGLDDNTIVIFTSDHGYHLGEHDFWQKMSLHEESAQIPLIFAGPAIRSGVAPQLAQQIDIYPTVAELAGLSIPNHCEGKSLAGIVRGREESEVHDAVFCVKPNGHLTRTQRYAYLRHKDGSEELYDMQDDLHQFTNIVNVDAVQGELAILRELLDEHLAKIEGRDAGQDQIED